MISILAICFVMMQKWFSSLHKKPEPTPKIMGSTLSNNKIEISNEKDVNSLEPSKNKWLYPTGGFGYMEKGIVYDSIKYEREIDENNTTTRKMKIINGLKKTQPRYRRL